MNAIGTTRATRGEQAGAAVLEHTIDSVDVLIRIIYPQPELTLLRHLSRLWRRLRVRPQITLRLPRSADDLSQSLDCRSVR